MRIIKFFIYLLFFFHLLKYEECQSQSIFNVTIVGENLKKIGYDKLNITYYNGKKIIKAVPKISQGKIFITDSFYSRYATLFINYKNFKNFVEYSCAFFVGKISANINFPIIASTDNPFENPIVMNAYELNSSGKKEFVEYVLKEQNELDSFYTFYGDKMENNDSLFKASLEREKKLCDKKIEYIKANVNQYYAFFVFKTQLIYNDLANPDSLLDVYNKLIPDSFKTSHENTQIKIFLEGKINTRKNHFAPDFTATTINGDVISLKKYAGKYVLLDFWASWCAPCVKEISSINQIRKKYSQDKLEIIFLSGDRDSTAFINAINKYHINGTHIFGEWEFKRMYVHGGIPQVYLINKEGRIVYSRKEDNDYDLILLKKLLKDFNL